MRGGTTQAPQTQTQATHAEERKQREREEEEDRTVALDSYLVGLPQPDVEGGFSEGIYGLLGEHVLQVTELSVNPR